MKKYVLLEKIHYFAEWCPLVFMKKISRKEGACDHFHAQKAFYRSFQWLENSLKKLPMVGNFFNRRKKK